MILILDMERYKNERTLLGSGVEEVKRIALTGGLRASRLRGVAWAILLEALPPEPDLWVLKVRQNRFNYTLIKERRVRDPRDDAGAEDDPLSQSQRSLWNQHFADSELRAIILLDAIRTFPGVEFFKRPEIQEAMVNVLFCYGRENPHLLYRQGMHEILAPLLFVLQCDRQTFNSFERVSGEDDLAEIMDPDHLEHDAYALFAAIMENVEKFYLTDETPPHSPRSSHSTHPPHPKRAEVQVARHLNDIRDNLLSKHDPELTKHLNDQDISLSLFGVRWLRVLFGREFTLQDLLVLWDAMFAEGRDLSLAGHVLVAMLIAIRTPLLNKDPMVCLTYLMHYPTSVDVQYVIEHALYLKHPEQYCRPAPRSFSVALPKNTASMLSRRHKSRSDPRHKLKVGTSANDDSGIIDGITLRDWENLNDEVVHAHNVMSLCSLKLEKYEEIIRQSLPSTLPISHPTYQALGGMKEICRLLNSRYQRPPEIEPALEADEFPVAKTKKSKKVAEQHTNEGTAPNLPAAKEVQLKVFNMTRSQDAVSGAPSLDPLRIHQD